jgi:protein-S-isoprenylcysteine O-methyltransferase Ste14
MDPTPIESAPEKRNVWLGRLRNLSVYVFIGFLVWLAKPTPMSFAIGTAFVIAGEAVRLWAAGHLVKSVELITSGPYARVQHPLYLGRLLILTGFGIMAWMDYGINLWVLAAGYAVFFLYYFPRKLRVEGNRLLERHGERYRSYLEQVPALIPFWMRYPGTDRRWSLRLALHNQEQFFITGLLVALALFLMKVVWIAT